MPKVSVPKTAGDEIIISAGGDVRAYKVTDGEVTVATDDLATFLGNVEGSKETAKPASSTTTKEKT